MMKQYLLLLMPVLVTVFLLPAIADETEQLEEATQKEPREKENEGIITNSSGMKLKLIEPGEFIMGSDSPKGIAYERPAHKVEISKAFYIGVYEVTQEQYEKITGRNPSIFKGADLPVDCVSWNDAKEFCRKLSEKEGVTYRLPTEAEWEYACRAGSDTEFYWGDDMDDDYAWYKANSDRKTHNVGTRKPNKWGLYDMSGNVFEWCEDLFEKYPDGKQEEQEEEVNKKDRAYRGGSFLDNPVFQRSSYRDKLPPTSKGLNSGFRVVREVD